MYLETGVRGHMALRPHSSGLDSCVAPVGQSSLMRDCPVTSLCLQMKDCLCFYCRPIFAPHLGMQCSVNVYRLPFFLNNLCGTSSHVLLKSVRATPDFCQGEAWHMEQNICLEMGLSVELQFKTI